jgi:hypothetical protein
MPVVLFTPAAYLELVMLDIRNESIGYLLPQVHFCRTVNYLYILKIHRFCLYGFSLRGGTPAPASRLTIHGGTSYIQLDSGHAADKWRILLSLRAWFK